MDAKRHPVDELEDELVGLYTAKAERWSPDVVISMDDDALEFLFEHRDRVFPGVPVVFGGLNVEDYDPTLLAGKTGYTGVVERLDLESTIELILELHPRAKRIVYIHDRTTSGLADRRTIQALADTYRAEVEFAFLDTGEGLSERELLDKLAQIGPNSIVYFLGFFRDKAERPLSPEYIIPLLSRTSPVPVYSHADAYLGFGILGGKLLSGAVHGGSVARKALSVLAGTPADETTVSVESSNRYAFDYRQLKRFSMVENRLPTGSDVLYGPSSFFERHRQAIAGVIVAFVFLAAFSAVLFVITLRLRAVEKRLAASEGKYRTLFEGNTAVKLLIDPEDGEIVDANPAAARFYGYSMADLQRMRVSDVDVGDCGAIYSGAGGRASGRAESVHRLADGSHRDVEVYASMVGVGDRDLVYCIVQDITQRKRNREELLKARDLLDSVERMAKVGGWEWDVASDTTTWTSETYRIFGMSESGRSAQQGPTMHESVSRFATEYQADVRNALDRCRRVGEPFDLEAPFTDAHGEKRWARTKGRAIEQDGAVVRVVCNVMDITEEKAAEAQLTEALAEKDMLMQELNHRVKNNLAIVSSLIALKEGNLGTQSDLRDLAHQIDAIRIVHEKLIETGDASEVALDAYLDDLLEAVVSTATDKAVVIDYDVAPVSVSSKTAVTIGLIVNELATNAVKYGFHDDPDPVFSLGLNVDEANGRYNLVVSNSGAPLPSGGDSIRPDGLGLRLVSGLVRQLKGEMKISRTPHPVFEIQFPAT
jgi:PAS domain S-box-containing protein